MKKIALRGRKGIGKFALVDNEDFELLNKWKWSITNSGYAARYSKKLIYMHRFIIETPQNMWTDHINGNKLDNRKINLRICSPRQNHQNQQKTRGSSIYKGVTWDKSRNKWQARIIHYRKLIYLGRHTTQGAAALAYNVKAKELFGEFAKLNPL